jgi:hypothetical protein
MITQTPSLKILQTKIGGINWGNCAKTVEGSRQNLRGITEINLFFATESFGRNCARNSNRDLRLKIKN